MFIKHPNKQDQTAFKAPSGNRQTADSSVPLVRYWTWRYVMILLVMLTGIGLFGMYWIRSNSEEQQFQLLEATSLLMTDSYSKMGDLLELSTLSSSLPAKSTESSQPEPSSTEAAITQAAVVSLPMELVPSIPEGYQFQIFDKSGKEINFFSSSIPEKDAYLQSPPRQNEVLAGNKIREQVNTQSEKWLRVGVPFYKNNQISGTLYMTAKYNEDRLSQMYGLIVLTIGLISICGWAVVYVLSRSLTRPLIQLGNAAKEVSMGNYHPKLPDPSTIKEGEISGLIHSFHEMTGRLNQLERMRTDLLAGVSHELRTPVTSIRGMLQAIQEGVVTGTKADEFVHIGLNEAKRLQVMVNDLLDFSSMESGEVYIEKSTIEIEPFLREIVQQLHTIPTYASVQVELDVLPSGLGCTFDRSHLKQICLNLLSNSVSASATHIQITARRDMSLLTLDLSDNGKGISMDEAPYIFERYYRGNSRRKKKQGLGLGLPICRLLTNENGGKIELLQTTSAGTAFRLTMPCAE